MAAYTNFEMPDREAFEEVIKDLTNGAPLDFTMIGSVFGPEFYELLLMTLLDANDAARAIQGAVNRLARMNLVPEIPQEVMDAHADAQRTLGL